MGLNRGLVTARILPSTVAEVDSLGHWTITLEMRDGSIDRFGGIRVYIPPGWTVPQVDDPAAEGYVVVDGKTNARLRTYLHTWRWITVQVEDGQLLQGDLVDVHYGQGVGARAPRVSEETTEFTVLVDADGFGNYDPLPESPRVTTVPGSPAAIEITAPSIVPLRQPFAVLIKTTDTLGNAVGSPGELELRLVPLSRVAEDDFRRLESSVTPVRTTLAAPKVGEWRIEAVDRRRQVRGSSPMVAVGESPEMKLFWGDIHGHSAASDGALSPEAYYAFARDISGLDFCALTDHDDVGHNSNVPNHSKFMIKEVWDGLQAITNRFNEPRKFVTLIGYEYSQIELGIEGHRNVYYRGDTGPLLHARDPRCNTPTLLFRCLAGLDALVIPHHPLHYMSWEHDPRVQRLVEVYSMWGTSEDAHGDCAFTGKMVSPGSGISWQAYLARGYRLGVTAGGDNHDSRPGRRGATDRWRKGRMAQPPGLVAVYAKELTRAEVFDALWARRCYGTTGERIILEFQLNGHWMGEEVRITRPDALRTMELHVVGEGPLDTVEILRNGTVVAAWQAQDSASLRVLWEDASPTRAATYYYARVRQKDGARAWSSPIWVDQAGT